MKIAYFGYNSFLIHKRGVENVIDFQSKAQNFESIYYLHWGKNTTAYKNNRFVCVSIIHCWYWPILLNFVLFRIKRKNQIIIHSHNPLFSFCSLFKTDILTVHDGLYYLSKSYKNKFTFIFRILESLVYLKCTMVHFISNYTKEQSLFGNRRNYVIIPNTSHFEPYMATINMKIVKSNKITVLVVRSLEERARFDLLLQVAEQLCDKNYEFIVAGKGPLLQYYQNKIKEMNLKNIEMLGYVDDAKLLNLYSECDMVLTIAEYGEGFGLPIIEAYLFNKPVIASDRCAIPEIIISDDYLFDNEVHEISKLIDQVSKVNKDNSFRKYYNLKYSNDIVLSQFRDLYNQFA
jgi:glycosyltransferase involved in cell wall biosynthesis